MSDNESSLITQFTDICHTEDAEARSYLEANNWDIEKAIETYFASINADNVDETNPQPSPPPPVQQQQHTGSGGGAGQWSAAAGEPRAGKSRTKAASSSSQSRVATLFTLNKKEQDSSESSSEEEGQAFYVGGSETGGGGQQVLGPPRHRNDPPVPRSGGGRTDMVHRLFQSAREHGAEVVQPHDGEQIGGKVAFSGAGYRLCDTSEDASAPTSATAPSTRQSSQPGPSPVTTTLKMWSNGFSVDCGPLRRYDDQSNAEFLSALNHGEVPQELVREARGGRVHVNMEDHRHEDYQPPPKPKSKPFAGEGHLLGHPTPPMSTTSRPQQQEDYLETAVVVLDETQPVTSIQVRLADGSKLVAKLNHHHTVADLRRRIVSQRPEYANQPFSLLTTFPVQELTEDAQTVAAANLLNAAVVQKLK